MRLVFSASNDGKMKVDKDGNKIISMNIEMVDLQTLAYFHLRSDTNLNIQGKSDIIECSGYVQDITIKDTVTAQFVVESEIDLNVMYSLCRAPESWTVRISNAQEQLSSFEKVLNYDFEAIVKAKKEKAQQKLGAEIQNQSLAENIVDTFGVEGAKEMVTAAREIVSGQHNGKTYNINIDKPGDEEP